MTHAPNEWTLEASAASTSALVLAERRSAKTIQDSRRRPFSEVFVFGSMLAALMIAGAATSAPGAGADRLPTCAAEDLSAFAVIEERSEVIGALTNQVVEAVRRFVQARNLCLSGRQDEGITLYQSAINTALGFDTPVVNAKTRLTAAALETPLHSR